MDIDQILVKQGVTLAGEVIKQSAQSIHTKITAAKNEKSKEESISELQEIINELIDERNQFVRITQVLEEKISMGKVSDGDIDYITNQIVPLLENLLKASDEEYSNNIETLETIKPILSKETFNILQLLGFNFQEAIGKPLTDLINNAIRSQISVSQEDNIRYNTLAAEIELNLINLSMDEEAYKRYLNLKGQ